MVLAPEPPLADWLAELDTWLERSPGFFFGRPVVLDVAVLQPGKEGLTELLQNLAGRNIKVMGIEGAEPSWLDFAMPPLLLSGRQASVIPGDNPPTAAEAPAPAPFSDPAPDAAAPHSNAPSPAAAATPQQPNSLLMDSSIRSGQCIVHPEGDVIVVGSVASGAEVIAGGSIHIYGTLRGRAIAGSRDARARIFCRKLEAELLSIDGLYMVADDMPAHLRGQPIQVWLDGDSMMMTQD
ncbi:MAG TPA: septum site-determining protein MinC [Methylocella sp.]|jgi:septum site-determining protein MinC|nr:septum site-determining protein MinC [Methylocella sp.]